MSAWAWGAWAFLLVVPNDERNYGYTWVVKAFLEALFFASGFLFLEKFILQLIGKHLSSIKYQEYNYYVTEQRIEKRQLLHFTSE